MRQMLRGYVELAAGLAEAAGKRVVGTAVELLERAGVDVEGAERAVTTQLPPAVQKLETLAQEVVTVGRGGLDLAVGLARAEAEKAVERVGKLGDQVVKAGVVLAYLEGKLRDLAGDGQGSGAGGGTAPTEQAQQESAGSTSGAPRPGRAESLFAADWQPEADLEPEPGLDAEPDWDDAQTGAAGWYIPPEPAAEPTAPRKRTVPKAAVKTPAAKTPAVKKTAAKKTAAKPTVAKKSAAKKTVAEKTAAKQTATKKTAAKKTATKKATPRKPAGDSDD
ncbi:hypothetical protein OG500_11645 [Kitasatospora sp. NBC_01250]|uniref:hypothetical protein n=1 Tax=Kitasatospora sp. NBC_01250 TaxID=2903571 RepID=UPI002E346B35|nr:hypothetical protein [Kitasatospora sp. NBC_01250]